MIVNFEAWVVEVQKESDRRVREGKKPFIRNAVKFERKVERRRRCILNGCAPLPSPLWGQTASGVDALARGRFLTSIDCIQMSYALNHTRGELSLGSGLSPVGV